MAKFSVYLDRLVFVIEGSFGSYKLEKVTLRYKVYVMYTPCSIRAYSENGDVQRSVLLGGFLTFCSF